MDFHFHFVNCSCCRAKFDGQEEGELCPICAIWNTKDGFSKRLVPVWQRLVGEQFHDIIDEVRGELYDYIDHDVGGLWEIGAEYEVEDDGPGRKTKNMTQHSWAEGTNNGKARKKPMQ